MSSFRFLVAFFLLCTFPIAILSQANCPKFGLERFVDSLPGPNYIYPVWNPSMNYPLYTVEMTESTHKFHRDLGETKMWLYNKQFPGPTFEVETYDKIHIKFINNLPVNRPLLPVDDLGMDMPQDRTVVHLHGSVSKPQYCGLPMDYVRPLNGSNSYTNYHANQQDAGLLFYHDHAMQITAPNVYAGLVGTYILRDDHERDLNLPRKQFEIPLVITDRILNMTDSQLVYFSNRNFTGGPFQIVNGKVWPYKEVEPGKYRFRILNAANHRFYNFSFSNNMPFSMIGVDQGFLKRAVTVTSLFLGPAERADIIVDFAGRANQNITLINTANEAFPVVPVDPCTAGIIMQFRVGKTLTNAQLHGVIPSVKMYDYENLMPDRSEALHHRNITLTLQVPAIKFLIGGKGFLDRAFPVPALNTVEIWEFQNLIGAIHPMHIHMVGFYVMERLNLNATLAAQGIIQYLGDPIPVPPTEYGRKDVAVVGGFQALRLIMKFEPYAGEFVYHCHLLEHEDDDMMRRFVVSPVGPDCQWDDDEQDEDCDFDD